MPADAADTISATEKIGLAAIPGLKKEPFTDCFNEDFAWFFQLPV